MKKRFLPVLVLLSLMLAGGLAMSAGCGGSKTTSGGPSTAPTSAPATTNAQTVGAPIYPGTKAEPVYAGVYKMVTGDSYDKVVAFYKKELPNATFSETTIPSGKGSSLLIDSADFRGNVSVEENMPSSGKVTVTVGKISTQ